MGNKITPLLLNKKDMLKLLSISSTTTLDKWVKDGKVPPPTIILGNRYPRWHRDQVEAFYAKISSSSGSPANHSTTS